MAAGSGDRKFGAFNRKEIDNNNNNVILPRAAKVKNKNTALVQITAEQVVREARESHNTSSSRLAENQPLKQKITDYKELSDHIVRKRKEFEDQIRRAKWNKSLWVKYAKWEESNKDFDRCRSVWERCLDASDHYKDHSIWLQYADFEMKNKFINHARNVWDRAVTLLPRVDQLWYKYLHMEEMLSNVSGARQIFERWMTWHPDQQAWLSYIKFELRYNEIDRARAIYERLVLCLPNADSWISYAKFEMKNRDIVKARHCYERAVSLPHHDDEEAEHLFLAFAKFEENCKETERAAIIYKFALDCIPKGKAQNLYTKFLAFQKQFGNQEGLQDAIVYKKRCEYEEELRKNPLSYDLWFDYIRLEESIVGNKQMIREVYERAISIVPPTQEKRYWQRYIYLWINYALFEELVTQDFPRTKDVYSECLKLIPHSKFSFSKIWLLAAMFEIRQLNLSGARAILGNAIGVAPKHKLFNKYIETELQLGEIDRCRKIYEKYLQWSPESSSAWCKYADLEKSLSETERARAIFELAIGQPALDTPELVWKTYIDFEMSEGEVERTRQLYEKLLDRTKHLKVWVSYAKFEASAMAKLTEKVHQEQRQLCIQRVRRVLENAINYYRTSAPELKEERAMLVEEWFKMERSFGELGDVELVRVQLPKKLKKRRHTEIDGRPAGYEEYTDYLFPEDESQTLDLKILELAYRWKNQKIAPEEDDME